MLTATDMGCFKWRFKNHYVQKGCRKGREIEKQNDLRGQKQKLERGLER